MLDMLLLGSRCATQKHIVLIILLFDDVCLKTELEYLYVIQPYRQESVCVLEKLYAVSKPF